MAPSTLVVLPIHRMLTSDQPAANINDHIPIVNILPFGMCMTPSNPAVAAATAAALGSRRRRLACRSPRRRGFPAPFRRP